MALVKPLKHPFEFGDRNISELTFNRLKGKHLRRLGAKPSMDDLMNLASKSCGEAPAVLDEMDAEDVMMTAEVIGDFLGVSLQTGESA